MTRLICDASVLFKLLVAEEDTDIAKSLASHYQLCVPEIVFAEIANALWARVRDRRLEASNAGSLIENFLIMPLDVKPLRRLISRALSIARDLDHPIYDCLYLALAEDIAAPLVTADRRFAGAVQRSSFRGAEVRMLAEIV
ncbi:type II toxin-antitoxin system VapC family toxin [Methyloceanibacter sp.]|uniref:type II toxin-antitoxin system VapC family toxin n=1 Tax=Methyloceanibacter sp. TaxID=1965321 RepID=UPI003D6D98D6